MDMKEELVNLQRDELAWELYEFDAAPITPIGRDLTVNVTTIGGREFNGSFVAAFMRHGVLFNHMEEAQDGSMVLIGREFISYHQIKTIREFGSYK